MPIDRAGEIPDPVCLFFFFFCLFSKQATLFYMFFRAKFGWVGFILLLRYLLVNYLLLVLPTIIDE